MRHILEPRVRPPLALALACLFCAVPHAGAEPFTVESALASQRAQFPEMARPSIELPAGASRYPNLCYARVSAPELCLDLVVPASPGPHPLVILVHGGGWDSGSRTMEQPFALALAARGYAAATVSYRLGPEGRFPNALHDLKAAVRWLRNHSETWHLNAKRIAIVGASAGGTLATLVGATNDDPTWEGNVGETQGSSRVQAVIDVDGLVDFTDPALVAQQNTKASAPTRFLGGSYAAREATWRSASALSHVGPQSAPTLFLCSTATSPLLPGREAMEERFRTLGVRTERVVFPHTPHVFWLFDPWFPKVVEACDAFLKDVW